MILIVMMLLLLQRIILMSGLMAVWFLVGLLVFLLLALAFLLIRLSVLGGVVGVMIFTLILIGRIVEVSLQFLGHFRLSRGLRCGVLFWPCTTLVVLSNLGVDNLGVVRHVDRLLRGCRGP